MSSRKSSGSWRGYALLVLAAAIPLSVAYEEQQTAALRAAESRAQFEVCQRHAADIERFRRQPKFAATAVLTDHELSALVARARAAAGIAETAIDLIDPQPLNVIGRSPYSRRPVAIDLRALNLRQVATLVDGLSDVEHGLWVSQLRLSPVRQQAAVADVELWNIKLVLTQLVFSPTSR